MCSAPNSNLGFPANLQWGANEGELRGQILLPFVRLDAELIGKHFTSQGTGNLGVEEMSTFPVPEYSYSCLGVADPL